MPRKKRGEEDSSAAVPAPPDKHVQPASKFCVVGIGASAGGVEAFKQMLQTLRKDTGMAYVLVLHLPAEHESMLTEILGRVSAIPGQEVYDRVPVEPNHAYVLPAGVDLDIADGRLLLSPR